MAHVRYVIEQSGACAWHRCRTPGMALAALGHKVDISYNLTADMAKAADVVVFQRPSHPATPKMIEAVSALGKRAVVELDDDLWSIERTSPAWQGWNAQGGACLRRLEACIRAASCATVTTDALAAQIAGLNTDVRVLPNMLLDTAWPTPIPRDGSGVVIGWAGSSTHLTDLMEVRGVIETVLDRAPYARLEIAGLTKPPFEHDRVSVIEPVGLDDYPALLSRFDIGLAPLADTRFNRAKSDLKYLEYAAVGIPTIASATGTYSSVSHGLTGYLARNGKDWVKWLGLLVSNGQLRRTMGRAARLYAESRFISANVRAWSDAYGITP